MLPLGGNSRGIKESGELIDASDAVLTFISYI
jgi:hypothetical protein